MDIKDPDNSDNWVCMSYLEKRIPEFNAKREKALQESKRDVMKMYQQKWMDAQRKKNVGDLFCRDLILIWFVLDYRERLWQWHNDYGTVC